jgi:histidyl-tRNA synthetase
MIFSPTIIRGLSYYNKNVFEIKVKGMRETLVAGGSYMFNNQQCTGVAFGLDRIATLAKLKIQKEKTLVISLAQDRKAIKLADKLRKKKGKTVSIFYGKPSKALEYANSYNYSEVIFIGADEIKKKKYKIKNMKTGKERVVGF